MADPVVYFEILGQDGTALRDFYSTLFGWKVEPVESSGGAYQRIKNAGIEGGIGAFEGSPSTVMFYVGTKDPEGVLARVTELGGEVVREPTTVADGVTTAIFKDPEGHVVGLISGVLAAGRRRLPFGSNERPIQRTGRMYI